MEIQLQLTDKGKSRRVRRQLLSKPRTLMEALDFARSQEMLGKQAERIEIHRQSHGADTNPEEKLYMLGQQAQSMMAGKVCFFLWWNFSACWRKDEMSGPGKQMLDVYNKMNHFAKCCRMKGKEDKGVLKAVKKDSYSSDAESLCSIEKVGVVKHNQGCRPVSSVTMENRQFQALVDTGAMVNVMDEITFKRLLADKVTLRRSSVLCAYQSNKNPSAPLQVMGKFEVIVESNTRIAPATFHVIKGHTNTEPLTGFQTAEDLSLIKVANTVQSEETITSNLLKEYADLFRSI